MKMVIMSVFDVAAGAFARPWFVASRALGVRMFSDEVQRKAEDNPMYRHPGDYQLFEMGEFDDNSGLFRTKDLPELVARATDFSIAKE